MDESNGQIAIYQTEDGQVQLEVAFEQDTVWLSQAQMVKLFGRDQSVVSRHIRNALAEGEVVEKSNMQKMHIANSDRPVVFYDLDVVISVGYRIKSERGVQFRRWVRFHSQSDIPECLYRRAPSSFLRRRESRISASQKLDSRPEPFRE